MNNKSLLIAALVFLFFINTSYFWEDLPGLWDIGVTIFLLLYFIILSVCLLSEIYKAIREKLRDRQRVLSVTAVGLILALTVLFPSGLIDFKRLEGKDILIAQREGAANCMTTFRLKKNKRFIQKSVCFGIEKKKGSYYIENDTIFLNNNSRVDSTGYSFAIIQLDSTHTGNAKGEINLYRNKDDKEPLFLLITKYDQEN